MTLDVFAIRIEELEELKGNIEQRIQELREQAGLAVDFYDNLQRVKEYAREFLHERIDEEDDQSIWEMFYALDSIANECLEYLRPKQA